MRLVTISLLSGILLLYTGVSSVYAQDVQAADDKVNVSALDLAKTDEIVDLLTASYAAELALQTVIRTGECTRTEPRCAPLFLAQDVILGPWNFVKLMRVMQELQDPQFSTTVEPRKYPAPSLAPTPALPAELLSLAQYAMEQQAILYQHLEAWQITMERLNAAMSSNDEAAATVQRRALEDYSSKASTAAAGVNAAASKFLESVVPLVSPFAAAIALEDVEATKIHLQEHGFGPELKERLSAFGIPPDDSSNLLGELTALSDDVPLDLLEGLTAVAKGYDKLADVMAVSVDASPNLRPVANAGADQSISAGAGDSATVVLDGTRSTDPDVGALEYLWTGASVNVAGAKPTIALPRGTHHIALTVADGKGGTDVDLVTITVADTGAPVITALNAMPATLWPPTRELVPVEINVKVADNDDPMPSCQIVSVSVDEPGNTTTRNGTEGDVVFEGSLKLQMRAPQPGANGGRSYTVTVQCTDKSNHSSSRSIVVSVSPNPDLK
jgi:hypothetical protein